MHFFSKCLEAVNSIEPVIKQLADETNTNRALLKGPGVVDWILQMRKGQKVVHWNL